MSAASDGVFAATLADELGISPDDADGAVNDITLTVHQNAPMTKRGSELINRMAERYGVTPEFMRRQLGVPSDNRSAAEIRAELTVWRPWTHNPDHLLPLLLNADGALLPIVAMHLILSGLIEGGQVGTLDGKRTNQARAVGACYGLTTGIHLALAAVGIPSTLITTMVMVFAADGTPVVFYEEPPHAISADYFHGHVILHVGPPAGRLVDPAAQQFTIGGHTAPAIAPAAIGPVKQALQQRRPIAVARPEADHNINYIPHHIGHTVAELHELVSGSPYTPAVADLMTYNARKGAFLLTNLLATMPQLRDKAIAGPHTQLADRVRHHTVATTADIDANGLDHYL